MRASLVGIAVFASLLAVGSLAQADDAQVSVGYAEPPPRRYADPPWTPPPPPRLQPVAVDDPPPYEEPEPYRSPLRLHLGPMGLTTGRSMGLGLGLAADFGRGSVGVRLAAAWMRGEPSSSDPSVAASPLGGGLSQYTGELTLDLHKRGPIHPVFGLGLGVARASRADGVSGTMGIGTARFGLEYALALDDADVRIGAGITGVLPGPADREVEDTKGYALVGASIGIGF
jgi:hypothetical protein